MGKKVERGNQRKEGNGETERQRDRERNTEESQKGRERKKQRQRHIEKESQRERQIKKEKQRQNFIIFYVYAFAKYLVSSNSKPPEGGNILYLLIIEYFKHILKVCCASAALGAEMTVNTLHQ